MAVIGLIAFLISTWVSECLSSLVRLGLGGALDLL